MRPRSSGGRNERARSWRETGSDERALVAAPMVRSQMPSVLPYRRPLHRLYPASSRAWRDTGHASGALATVLAAMGSGAGETGRPRACRRALRQARSRQLWQRHRRARAVGRRSAVTTGRGDARGGGRERHGDCRRRHRCKDARGGSWRPLRAWKCVGCLRPTENSARDASILSADVSCTAAQDEVRTESLARSGFGKPRVRRDVRARDRAGDAHFARAAPARVELSSLSSVRGRDPAPRVTHSAS